MSKFKSVSHLIETSPCPLCDAISAIDTKAVNTHYAHYTCRCQDYYVWGPIAQSHKIIDVIRFNGVIHKFFFKNVKLFSAHTPSSIISASPFMFNEMHSNTKEFRLNLIAKYRHLKSFIK